MGMKTKLNLVAVVEGNLWRSESGDTRISHPCSQWFVTLKRFIGGDTTESFASKAEMLRWMKKNNMTVNFPKS
jgi:hypothetical protein